MPDTNVITQTGEIVDQKIGVRKVDVRRGALDGSVSSQWHSRPDDQRFLSLEDLTASLKDRRERSTSMQFNVTDLAPRALEGDDESLWLEYQGKRLDPTHWSFGQLCQRVTAPAANLRRDVPGLVAAIYLQSRLFRCQREQLGMLQVETDTGTEMRALTGPDYGRVFDLECAQLVEKINRDGTWKVPGVIDWRNGTYDPNAPVTKQSTTLYASDRDLFIFMVRDQYSIEVGKLHDGSPDLIFPGFIISNSETGSRSLTLETMFLRGVCQNRNLWGVEGKQTLRLRHTSGLPSRFIAEAMPRLKDFANTSANAVARKVMAAKAAELGDTDKEVSKFLMNHGYGVQQTKSILEAVVREEKRPARSIWDVVQGATAVARSINHQDARVDAEREAGKLMDLVKV